MGETAVLESEVIDANGMRHIYEFPRVADLPWWKKLPSARQLVRQDGGVRATRAGRGRPGWPMAAHQLASAYKNCQGFAIPSSRAT